MACRTALAALPSLTSVAGQITRTALFAETYRRIVVHGGLRDVRFVGYAS